MTFTVGEKFILSCIRQNSQTLFVSAPEDLFRDAAEKRLFNFTRDYLRKYGDFPPGELLSDSVYPGGGFKFPDGEADAYLSLLRKLNASLEISEAIPKIVATTRRDAFDAVKLIQDLLAKIHTDSKSTDFFYDGKDFTSKRFEEYLALKGTGGVTYLSTGYAVLDELFSGWQVGDFIVIGGRPGLGKTWMILDLTVKLDNFIGNVLDGLMTFKTTLELTRPILFISNEMSEAQLAQRLDSMRFKLPYGDFIKGKLSRRDERRYKENLEDLVKKGSNIVIAYQTNTFEQLEEKIRLYNPLAVFIDGIYLFYPEMEEGPSKNVFLTRNAKSMAMTHRVPIIATTQLRKKSAKGESSSISEGQDAFAYGGFIQDGDIVARAYQTPDMVFNNLIGIEFPKGRRMPPGHRILWECDLTTMDFNYLSDDTDIDYAAEAPSWK